MQILIQAKSITGSNGATPRINGLLSPTNPCGGGRNKNIIRFIAHTVAPVFLGAALGWRFLPVAVGLPLYLMR